MMGLVLLERLRVQNLGCLDENIDSVSFSQETVLIGPNNSGKSTLIAGLNLLRYAVLTNGGMSFSTSLYNFHEWTQAVCNHEKERIIRVSATLDSNRYDLEVLRGSVQTVASSDIPWGDENCKIQMRNIWYLRPNRSLIPYSVGIGRGKDSLQPQLSPSGVDVVQFLLERYTERNPSWDEAEEWFKKIDPELLSIRTPIRGSNVFFENLLSKLAVNASLQGSGFQSVASVISAVVFSPKGSTVIIEEPEICLHKKSQEAIVDLFNHAVKDQGKQIIFATHSWDMLLPFISDVGRGRGRGKQHVRADPGKFTLLAFEKSEGHVRIEPIDLSSMKVSDVTKYLNKLWGSQQNA